MTRCADPYNLALLRDHDTVTALLSPAPAVTDPMDVDMRRVDEVIGQRLASEVALINQISHYIVSAGGKRIRPRLVLLFSQALGFLGQERFELAATVEFIHTATLLHDDVVDESSLRRGRQTANALFGNAASVLVGDFLYSRAFQMMVGVNRLRVLDVLADATNVIAEGEVLQLMNIRDASLDEDAYLRVIRSKTAKLFEASCRLAAVLAGSPPELEAACAEYGQSLGTAFQVIDDVLDYDGDAGEMGKNLGDDLREGKVTLPLILAMRLGTPDEAATIRQAIETGSTTELAAIVTIVRRCGALEGTRLLAAEQARRAIDALRALPHNTHADSLLELPAQLLQRRS